MPYHLIDSQELHDVLTATDFNPFKDDLRGKASVSELAKIYPYRKPGYFPEYSMKTFRTCSMPLAMVHLFSYREIVTKRR